jgi:DNA polymerase
MPSMARAAAGLASPVPMPAAPKGQVEPAPVVLDLDGSALSDAIRSCRACGLCEGRQQAVPGVGAVPSAWMVVGEAPGEQEDQQGEPFVGPAGRLLDAMLEAMALQRTAAEPSRQVYITNTVKCRPPRNRTPELSEQQACRPFLQRELALVNPKLVLLFGRVAAQAVLGTDEALGKLRGRVHRLPDGRPAVVTYHPSYLLRQPQEKLKAWEDLCLAMDTFDRLP